MKKTVASVLGIAAGLLVIGSAYAVSIEFPSYSAVEIGPLVTTTSEDGLTTQSRIEFSGKGLAPLMALLPAVTEFDKPVSDMRMLSIGNWEAKGITEDKTTMIYFECNTKNISKVPECNITIITGQQPG